jgi:D-3-phosphoglycerate dehydrogenase/(S)-sulfolactate dehydrogenase
MRELAKVVGIRAPGIELSGKSWGLLGCGATAIATAKLLQGFNIRFTAYDPFVTNDDPRIQGLQIQMAPLEDVLKNSVLSIHMPSNAQTNGLINSKTIAMLRWGFHYQCWPRRSNQ